MMVIVFWIMETFISGGQYQTIHNPILQKIPPLLINGILFLIVIFTNR